MSTDYEQEPTPTPESAGAPLAKPGIVKSTRILAFAAGGVVAAAAFFGGGVAFGTSLNTGAGSSAQQGQFGGTPPGGTSGTGGTGTGTAPNGTAPTGAAGGTATTG
jgi:hypothetical protein